MTDMVAIDEQLSETEGCSEKSSCHVTRGEADSMCPNHSENASLGLVVLEDGEVDGDVTGLCSAAKIGQKRAREPETMDHSGLESRKIPCVLSRVGAKQCLSPPPLEELKQLSYIDCGKELARCLDESKCYLIIEVVKCLGVEKTYEFFSETAKIQSNGGVVSADGDYKRSPGGVFLSLVKTCTSMEQRYSIFKYKRKAKSRGRLQRKKIKREMKLKKRKDEWRAEALRVSQSGHNPEFGEVNGSLVQADRNMDKRLPGNSSASNDSFNTGQNDLVEENCRTNSDDTSDGSHDHVRESHFHLKKSPTSLNQEILAAEEFERTSYCHLDFDPEIEWF